MLMRNPICVVRFTASILTAVLCAATVTATVTTPTLAQQPAVDPVEQTLVAEAGAKQLADQHFIDAVRKLLEARAAAQAAVTALQARLDYINKDWFPAKGEVAPAAAK